MKLHKEMLSHTLQTVLIVVVIVYCYSMFYGSIHVMLMIPAFLLYECCY